MVQLGNINIHVPSEKYNFIEMSHHIILVSIVDIFAENLLKKTKYHKKFHEFFPPLLLVFEIHYLCYLNRVFLNFPIIDRYIKRKLVPAKIIKNTIMYCINGIEFQCDKLSFFVENPPVAILLIE